MLLIVAYSKTICEATFDKNTRPNKRYKSINVTIFDRIVVLRKQ